jgi:Ala-tRNA(Pro) deacylase
MSIPRRLKQYLEANHVPYTPGTHTVAFTAQELAAAAHVPGQQIAKTVVVKGDEGYALVVLPGTLKIDLAALRGALPFNHLDLASENEFMDLFPDSQLGAMPPFGNLYDLPVYVDQSLTEDDEIVFNAGSHIETIRMKYADFARLVEPKVIDVAEIVVSRRGRCGIGA